MSCLRAMMQTLFIDDLSLVLLFVLTLDEQVAGGADSSRLVCGGAGEASTVFSECFADHQLGESVLIANLEINGALNLVVLSEPHDNRLRVTADLALQGHRLALCHICVLQALQRKQHSKSRFPNRHGYTSYAYF